MKDVCVVLKEKKVPKSPVSYGAGVWFTLINALLGNRIFLVAKFWDA